MLLLRLTSGASFVPFYGPVAMKPLPPLSGNNKTEPKEKLPLLTLKKIVQMYVLVHGADSIIILQRIFFCKNAEFP